MRHLLSLTLALLIAVTSQQMAMARAVTHDVAGQVVLCTGQGVQTVTLDHQGNPIELVHICPDCVITLADVSDVQTRAQPPVVHIHKLTQPLHVVAQTAVIPSTAHARGPPRIV